MLPLFDVMLKAQNGESMLAMARQFGLAQEQASKAITALIPAFSTGFKRSSHDPYGLASLVSGMASGSYAKYFEDIGRAFTPQGVRDGNVVLEHLFGSKDMSRAIAQQAELYSGIGQDILKRMMPVMADTLMGGFSKEMTGQIPSANTAVVSAMNEMTRQWMEMAGWQPKAAAGSPGRTATGAGAFDNPFAEAMRSIWGLGRQDQPPPTQISNPFLDNPAAKAFNEMLANTFAAFTPPKATAEPAPKAQPDARAAEPPASLDAYGDIVRQMFTGGIEVQKTYQRNVEAIFDTYLGKSAAAH
ncbi:MAG: DUF937 domain-containing protein [Neorhizobium sp.]|nr:DUF937 domain-containing protein [Neorhizobium sp.]